MIDLFTKNPNTLLFAGLAFLTIWLMMRLAKRHKTRQQQGTAATLTPDERLERMKQERGVKGDLEGLMVEIEELSKRVGTRLDVKIVQVERLIRDADQRIAELQRLQGSADPSSTGLTPGSNPSSQQAHAAASPSPEPPPGDELSRNVYRLADSGHTPVEIARTLREHVGKVELILALRRA